MRDGSAEARRYTGKEIRRIARCQRCTGERYRRLRGRRLGSSQDRVSIGRDCL